MRIENKAVRMKIVRDTETNAQLVHIMGISLGFISDDDLREVDKTLHHYVRSSVPGKYIEKRWSMKKLLLHEKLNAALGECKIKLVPGENEGEFLIADESAISITEHLCKHGVLVPQAITDAELIEGIQWAGDSPDRWRDWLVGLSKKTELPVDEIEGFGIDARIIK